MSTSEQMVTKIIDVSKVPHGPRSYYVESCAVNRCSTAFQIDFTSLPSKPRSVSVRVSSEDSLQINMELPKDDGGANITRYAISVKRNRLVASAWIPSFKNSIPSTIKAFGQFITDGTVVAEDFTSATIECASETTRVHRELMFDQTLTQLNKIKNMPSSHVSFAD